MQLLTITFLSKRERKNRDTNLAVFVTVSSLTCFQIVRSKLR